VAGRLSGMTALHRGATARLSLFLAGVLVVLGGCSPQSGTDDRISHPTGPTDLVLRVAFEGGFAPQEILLTQTPGLSLYGDGTLITQGAQTAIFPGPAIAPLQMTRVTDTGMQRILRAARAAGLMGPDRHYENNSVADASTTVFTLNAGGGVHRISAYALFDAEDTMMIPADHREPRRLLLALQQDLMDVRNRLGEDVAGPDLPYVPTAMRIVSREADPKLDENQALVKLVDWPLQTSLATFGEPRQGGGIRCGTVEGAELVVARPAFTAAHQLTYWRSAGKFYRLQFRPLLPDERGPCPADS
jgi:hypothetical protein